MCGKLGRASSMKRIQNKTLDTKGNKNKRFLKTFNLFIAEIPTSPNIAACPIAIY